MSLFSSRFSLVPGFLAGAATVTAIVIGQAAAIAAKSPQEIAQVAIPLTVQVNSPVGQTESGSGVIIARQGTTYTVLTCDHVGTRIGVNGTIRTHDGQSYPITNLQPLGSYQNKNEPDLAVLTFNSPANYPVATLTNSEQAVIGAQIFIAGYPVLKSANKFGSDRDFEFSPGFVMSRRGSADHGYILRYNAITLGGMSGGPVFDTDGRVVGIHGLGEQELGRTQTQGGDSVSVSIKTGINSAIPMNAFLALKPTIGQSATRLAVNNTPSTDKPAARLSNPQSAPDFLAKGLVQHDQGNKSGAIGSYTQAIRLDPNSANAYYQRGDLHYDQGNVQGAIDDYTQAVRLNPELANAYYNRGVVRYQTGDKQGALDDMNQVLRLTPGDATAYQNRATINRRLNNRQQAFEDFDQVVRLTPSNPRAYYNRAVARLDLNDRQGTIEDFNQVLSLDPTFVLAYISRAQVRRRLGDREGAIEDLNQALSLKPDDAVAYYTRGLYRRDLGELEVAIEDLQKAAELFRQQSSTSNYQKALEKIAEVQQRLQQPARVPSSTPTSESNSTGSSIEGDI